MTFCIYCFSELADSSLSIPCAPLPLLMLFFHSAVPFLLSLPGILLHPQSSAYIAPTCGVFPDPSTSSPRSPLLHTFCRCACVLSCHSVVVVVCFFNKFIYLFIYFWLCWVFVAVRGLPLVAVSGSYSSCGVRWLLLLWSTDSRHVGFSSCSMWAQ